MIFMNAFPLSFSKVLSLVVLLSLPAFSRAESEVMVVGDRVNLRTESGLDSDIIGQVDYGDLLVAVAFEGDWVQVRPPDNLVFWVHGGLLFEEREVRSRVLNIRAGPGTQFSVVGQLERGDPVTVRGSHEDWRRIDTPDVVTLWISRDFIERRDPLPDVEADAQAEADVVASDPFEAEEADAAEEAADDGEAFADEGDTADAGDAAEAEAEEPEPEIVTIVEIETVERIVEVPVVPTPTPTVAPPADLDLVPLQGQGTASVRRGVVKAYLISGSAPSRFQLVHREGGHEVPLAYLIGDEEAIRNANGQSVVVRGRDFWVAGRRVPVTRVESLERISGSRE